MIAVNLTGKLPDLGALPGNLEAARERSVKNAQRDALKSARTFIAREAVSEYYLKYGQVLKTIHVAPPVLTVKSGFLSLDKYKLSPTHPLKRRVELRAAVKRSSGLKPLGRAFLVNIHGKYKPFVRVESSRLPIRVLVGPSTAQIAGGDTIGPRLEEHVMSVLPERLEYWWGVESKKAGVR